MTARKPATVPLSDEFRGLPSAGGRSAACGRITGQWRGKSFIVFRVVGARLRFRPILGHRDKRESKGSGPGSGPIGFLLISKLRIHAYIEAVDQFQTKVLILAE